MHDKAIQKYVKHDAGPAAPVLCIRGVRREGRKPRDPLSVSHQLSDPEAANLESGRSRAASEGFGDLGALLAGQCPHPHGMQPQGTPARRAEQVRHSPGLQAGPGPGQEGVVRQGTKART